jgi:LPXTG-motif cell wall-anchored protein
VYQPDRLQIDEPTLYDTAYVGNETTITMSYVNKGKGDMSNVEATISGDGVDILQATQYLGNFASGQSGNISFVVTPWMEGDTELLITITYEDANEQSVTREFPMTLSAVEMDWCYDDPSYWDEPIDEPEETGTGIGLWVGIAGGGIVLLLLLVLLVRRRKKKSAAKRAANTWDDWDEEEPQPTPEEQPAGTAEKGE